MITIDEIIDSLKKGTGKKSLRLGQDGFIEEEDRR